jgi:hypothetical protein
MGHPGYNSGPNNGSGYASRERALQVVRQYSRPQAHPDPETAFEMRAAFGPGVQVVNVVTGRRYRT